MSTIKTWQERLGKWYSAADINHATQAEIDELRAALATQVDALKSLLTDFDLVQGAWPFPSDGRDKAIAALKAAGVKP